MHLFLLLSVILSILLSFVGCGSGSVKEVRSQGETHLALSHFVAPDGSVIPVRTFMPNEAPLKALVIGIHGFNDYSRAFATVGPSLAAHHIGLLAYDQRGFGLAGGTGLWAGSDQYGEDLRSIIRAAKDRYHDVPIYLLGESMGAAVVIKALEKVKDHEVDGIILSAPAVWSRDTMPWYQSLILEVAATTFPDVRLTGSGLRVQASDNLEMLRGLGQDPWVIKATRIDAIHGLADLMDDAQVGVEQVRVPMLILYGGKDEIIPADPVRQMWRRVAGKSGVRAAYYPQGYHLLLRDLKASIPVGDLLGWIENRAGPLPSGCEVEGKPTLTGPEVFQVSEACLYGHAASTNPVLSPDSVVPRHSAN